MFTMKRLAIPALALAAVFALAALPVIAQGDRPPRNPNNILENVEAGPETAAPAETAETCPMAPQDDRPQLGRGRAACEGYGEGFGPRAGRGPGEGQGLGRGRRGAFGEGQKDMASGYGRGRAACEGCGEGFGPRAGRGPGDRKSVV